MADKNILIGIGGTGAKIAEAFTHLCAAGLGPSEIEIEFAEQDRSNGNLSRAISTISNYLGVQRALRRVDSAHAIRRSSEFCATRIKPLGVDDKATLSELDIRDCIWVPNPTPRTRLSDEFEYDRLEPDVQNLFRTLYEPGPNELGLRLDDGYQGRPHIGALAMMRNTTGKFWDDIGQAVERAQGGKTNIFLAGSIFGGTGAAGFPTLARHIRNLVKDRGMKGVKLSGILMLPYFSFGSDEDKNRVTVQSSELLAQTKVSLEYYSRLLDTQTIFDDLYLVGWSPMFHLPYNQKGNSQQCNPPLAPELLAALAAATEFSGEGEGADGKGQRVLACGRENEGRLSWLDLPPIGQTTRASVQQGLGKWLRFCFAWKYMFRPSLERPSRKLPSEQWFRMFANEIKFEDPGVSGDIKQIDTYVDSALHWAASMAYWSARKLSAKDSFAFDLWKADRIATEDTNSPYPEIVLRQPGSVAFGDLDDLLTIGSTQGDPDTAAILFERINARSEDRESRGLGKIINAVFESAALSNASAN